MYISILATTRTFTLERGGSRTDAHLFDTSDSEKARRVAAIHGTNLTPIVRVLALDLSEHDALVIEKTLLLVCDFQTFTLDSHATILSDMRPNEDGNPAREYLLSLVKAAEILSVPT